jgi:hypothetical protein
MGFRDKVKGMCGAKKAAPVERPYSAPMRSTAASSSGKQMSLLKLMMNQNVDVSYSACGIDGETTPIGSGITAVISHSERIAEVTIDVGGQCDKCNAARCGRHSIWIAMSISQAREMKLANLLPEQSLLDEMSNIGKNKIDTLFLLGCRTCRTIYAGGPMTTYVLV